MDYIGSCNLEGKQFTKVLKEDSRASHPFAVAVFKDLMYWDDWKINAIFSADKDLGIMITPIAENMTSLMDIKVYGHLIQIGKNPCETNRCSYICVGAPGKSYSCLCPDGMTMTATGECLCPGLQQPQINKTCPQLSNTCAPGFFTCANKLCIPGIYRCDGDDGKIWWTSAARLYISIETNDIFFEFEQIVAIIRMRLAAHLRSIPACQTCSNANLTTNAFPIISCVITTMVTIDQIAAMNIIHF